MLTDMIRGSMENLILCGPILSSSLKCCRTILSSYRTWKVMKYLVAQSMGVFSKPISTKDFKAFSIVNIISFFV